MNGNELAEALLPEADGITLPPSSRACWTRDWLERLHVTVGSPPRLAQA